MAITLSNHQIDQSLPSVARGLGQYFWVQARVAKGGKFHDDAEFRRRYNHFYRVRRGGDWQKAYYDLMGQARERKLTFEGVLEALQMATFRVEASFASKLFATIQPSSPVIDSVVLRNVGLKLPYAASQNRLAGIGLVYSELTAHFREFLATDSGRYLVKEFSQKYPDANVTQEKMLDLVLWQTR